MKNVRISHVAARRSALAIALSLGTLAACVPETGTPPVTTTTTIPGGGGCVDGIVALTSGSVVRQLSDDGTTVISVQSLDEGGYSLAWYDLDSGESGVLGESITDMSTMSADGSRFLWIDDYFNSSAQLVERDGTRTQLSAPDGYRVGGLGSDDLGLLVAGRPNDPIAPTGLEYGTFDVLNNTVTPFASSVIGAGDGLVDVDSDLSHALVRRASTGDPWDPPSSEIFEVVDVATGDVARSIETGIDESLTARFVNDDTVFLTGGRPIDSEDEMGTAYWHTVSTGDVVSQLPPAFWATPVGTPADPSRVLWAQPFVGFTLVTTAGSTDLDALPEPYDFVTVDPGVTRLLYRNEAFETVQVCLP